MHLNNVVKKQFIYKNLVLANFPHYRDFFFFGDHLGAQQGPVMLTSKNLQCMKALLTLAQNHGSILGTAWHLVLTTLQVI